MHRDLKPDNIFLDYPDPSHFPKYPRPLVGDFGLSFLTSEADETNPYYWATAAGTHGYMPPEQTSFQDPIDKKPVDDFKILSPCNGKSCDIGNQESCIETNNDSMGHWSNNAAACRA